MIVKMLLVGDTGTGKTHLCVEVSKAIKSILIDVDDGAEEIIQKLEAENTVLRLDGTPYSTFLKSLALALKQDASMIIIDSLTELKVNLVQHIKGKVMDKGEFYIGGVQRDEPKKIADKDLFVLTWELYPVVYDRIREITRLINSKDKSYILTYHPPIDLKSVSKGEVQMFAELKRITNIVAHVSEGEDKVIIKKDRFLNLKELDRETFITYLQTILEAKHIKEVKQKMEDSLVVYNA